MGYYEHYAKRHRFSAGIMVKLRQAAQLFHLGFSDAMPNNADVLELGPGDGLIANMCRDHKFRYVGIEASKDIAAKLQEAGHCVVRASVPPLPSDLGEFDVCYMLHIIEHLRDMEAAGVVLREIRERLRSHGRLVIACPDFSRWKHWFYDCDYTHVLPFTRRRLHQVLVAEGYDVMYESIYVGPLFGHLGAALFWPISLMFTPTVDYFLSKIVPRDAVNRGFLTFIPNLVAVARRSDA